MATLSEFPLDEQQILDQLTHILSASMNAASPGYIGHMDSIPTLMSILGDLITSAVNNNMLSVEMSPIFSQLEPLLVKQFSELFGLGNTSGGMLLSGGTLANLQAIAVARNSKFDALAQGIVGLEKQPVLFASEVAHTSVKKAAMLLGLGTSAVISVPTNHKSQISVDALKTCINHAIAVEQTPFCIVATAGTTTTGNIDPIDEIYQIAQAHNLWLHVDASYGGALMFSPQHRPLLSGVEYADSITFNPQKWLYVAKTCVMVMFKRFDQLKMAFQIQAPYMKEQNNLTNLGEISLQGTRHADILKLWLSIQHIGKQGYAQLIKESYRLTDFFVESIKARPFLEMASVPEMNIICFRGTPNSIPSNLWNAWNTKLQLHLLKHKNIFCSLPLYRESRWLRVVILNPYVEKNDIARLFEAIDEFVNQNTSNSFTSE